MGKISGRPVCDLLGGRAREKVPFAAYLYYKFQRDDPRDEWGEVLTPGALVQEARMFVKRYGFKTLKLKGGVLHPDKEVETLRMLEEEFPKHKLRIDPNGVWTVDTSIRVGKELDKIDNMEYYEDPTLDAEDMAKVNKEVEVPLATNSCVQGWGDILKAFRLGSIDVVLDDLHYWGGLRAGKQLGKTAKSLNWGVSMHSNSHLGVSMAAMLHLGATTPELTYDADTHYPWRIEDVIKAPFAFKDGCLTVPDKPGLGIEIDEKKLSDMNAYYKEMKDYPWDFQKEMKKYDPSWEMEWPRW
jgi:glucarate dehydratase